MTTAWTNRWQDGMRYGGLGLPLAFVALPLYVVVPNHYAARFGVPLAVLGAVLLGVRFLDALVDPWIGRWADRVLARPPATAWLTAGVAALLLALGFRGLMFPWVSGSGTGVVVWFGALLAATTLGYSVLSILHQAWGARLGGGEAQRARVVAWREGLALVGVLLASVLPTAAGLSATTAVFAAALATAIALLRKAPRAGPGDTRTLRPGAPASPLHTAAFRRLLTVYLVNGIASAIPATLVLFFIRDRLQAPGHEALFLLCYFGAGALSIPLWVRVVRRVGLARGWWIGMLLATAVFAWAALLGEGDVVAFAAVCLLSGAALGADLTLPGAIVAGVIQGAGHGGRAEGAYFGWWNFATKLNLALAAGIALPLLQWAGYAPGGRSPEALDALTFAYCVVPCVLKLLAATLLATLWIRHQPRPA